MHMYFMSTYSLIPYFDPSLPKPDCLMPPNGILSADTDPSLMPNIPHSSCSATRHICFMSVEKEYAGEIMRYPNYFCQNDTIMAQLDGIL